MSPGAESRSSSRRAAVRARAALLVALVPTLLPAAPAGLLAQRVEPRYEEEVGTLANHPAVQRAMEAVERLDGAGMETLVELTEIPAPPFMEEVRGERFAELLREAGADSVWTDAEGNVIGLRRGRSGGRTVVLGGHLDTVFPEGTDVTVHMRGDTLYAPGVGDDTRGLVVVLTVLQALEEAGVETDDDLLFVGTVGEEGLGDLRGMKHLFPYGEDDEWGAGRPIDAWVEIDGGGLSRLVTQGLGSVRYRVTFEGPGGHSWGAFGTANPAHALARAVRYFQDVADTLTRRGPRTSYNVGRIGGGTSVNSVPFEAWMEVDMRSVSPERLAEIEASFLAAMERGLEEENGLRREGPPLELSADKIGDRPSGALDPGTPLIQRAMAATLRFDAEPDLARSSTNSNIPIALGIPAVTLGRGGRGGDAHAPGEWWLNADGYLAIQRALLVLVAEAGLAGMPPVGS
ncbi:MAG: M20/M25/M40 family metallo-hydrolase [Gemmatimonadota bacterium]